MLHKIFKYSLAVQEKQEINLPTGAQIIRVADVDGLFFLWAIVDTECSTTEVRKIEMYKTGHEFTTHTLVISSIWVNVNYSSCKNSVCMSLR